MDLGKFVRESTILDWLDVFLAFREVTTVYEKRVYMIPLDGDVLSFFYRRDILEHFNLKVPRTWDEYAEVAEAVHGKTYNGTTLSGHVLEGLKDVLEVIGQTLYMQVILNLAAQRLDTCLIHEICLHSQEKP